MATLLTLSYLAHVVAGGLWTGATLYVAYLVFVGERPEPMPTEAVLDHMSRLLWITRWTGVVLPVTGLYQLWLLYPVDRLLSTPDGWYVIAMIALWGTMNTAIEAGAYAVRREVDPIGPGAYMLEGLPATTSTGEHTGAELLGTFRPYLLASAVMAVALLGTAALLAAPG